MTSRSSKRFPWAHWPDERLLDLRICDLGVSLDGTWVAGCLATLYRELEQREVVLRPRAWLSHDWFSPDGVPGVAIPFYLVHPRLMRLEKKRLFEVEGGTREECLRILRHEAGHALQHAYRPHRDRRWRATFGKSSTPYPNAYRPNPSSRRFVQHLRLYYAQSHPDEDFAETFAVWMQPQANWRQLYKGWPALKKLEYVDELMTRLRGRRPIVRSRMRLEPVERLRITLRKFYEEKERSYAVSYPDLSDRDLRRIFSDSPRHRRHELASRFIARHRAGVRRTVARWTGEYELTLDHVLRAVIVRCREMELRAVGPDWRLLLDLSGMLAIKTLHHLYSRRLVIPL